MKMAPGSSHAGTIAGTLSGTLLAFFGNIHSADVLSTSVLATIGAVVSFTISLLLKWISKKVKKK